MTNSLWRKRQEPEQPTPKWQGARFDSALHDQPPQPEQEPVGQLLEDAFGRGQVMWFNKPKDESMLYTTPPQRKPLTENEIKHLWYKACQTNLELTSQLIVHLARNIEAAHGIKE